MIILRSEEKPGQTGITHPATLLSLVKPRICRRGANRGQNNDESLDLEDKLL